MRNQGNSDANRIAVANRLMKCDLNGRCYPLENYSRVLDCVNYSGERAPAPEAFCYGIGRCRPTNLNAASARATCPLDLFPAVGATDEKLVHFVFCCFVTR